MSNKRIFIGFSWVGLAVILFTLSAMSGNENPPRQAIEQNFHNRLTAFENAVSNFRTSTVNLSESTLEECQQIFLDTRLRFREIEYLTAYYDPQFVKDHLNGPPLPRPERKTAMLVVLEPTGLQIIDELLFAEEPLAHISQIQDLAQKLEEQTINVCLFQRQLQIQDRHFFEAARQELIRIMALQMTGFDVPASDQVLLEMEIGLSTVQQDLQSYKPYIAATVDRLSNRIDDAIDFLRATHDLESLDRLTLVRNYLDPLYHQLLEAHHELKIETIALVTKAQQPVNYEATSMFADNLLNEDFFTDFAAKADDPNMVELGRILFFDPILSGNNQRACASCHNPKKGFADGFPKSAAFDQESTIQRNAPTVINAVYAERYFYDLRANQLSTQLEHVLFSQEEFHSSYAAILEKLNGSKEYRALFVKAFPAFEQQPITKHTFSTALVAYLKSLKSFNSPFDQYMRGETKEIDPSIHNGFNVFMGKGLCGTCHFAPTFNGSVPPLYTETETEVLGIPANSDTLNPVLDGDLGRFASGRPQEETEIYKRSFKTVSVRNVALTAPYMHNGAFNTLEEVVNFYEKGGGEGLGFNLEHQTLPFDKLELTAQEKADLVAFMQSLTDTTNLTTAPTKLPLIDQFPALNQRPIGGSY